MNGTDNLLRQALRSLDHEVRISQDDVAAAQRRFAQMSSERTHRRRTVTAVAVAAVTVGAVAGGAAVWSLDEPAAPPVPAAPAQDEGSSGADGTPPTSEDLVGLWAMPGNSGWVWEFHADGTSGWENPGRGTGYEQAFYQVHEGVLDSTLCAFSVRLVGNGTMVGTATSQNGLHRECPWADGEEQTWIRVSPAAGAASAPGLGDLVPAGAGGPSAQALPGVWWQEGTGMVLLVSREPDGLGYRLDDDGEVLTAPDDSGTAILDDRGDLTLTSREGCAAGSSVALTELAARTVDTRLWLTPVRVLTATSEPGACPVHADLGGTWLRVP